jgi:hypothetical protein
MILDCTLRDGGYYTDWNFPKVFLQEYLNAVNSLSVGAVEIGYCSNRSDLGFGEFYYSSKKLLSYVRSQLDGEIELGVMLNAKEFSDDFDFSCLEGKTDYLDFIRIAADPKQTDFISQLVAEIVKTTGLRVYINFMYMHQYGLDEGALHKILSCVGDAEGISLVDSYGCMRPDEVKTSIEMLRPIYNKKLGFHGHDNLGLVAANCLSAIDAGSDIIDCTFTGMGRGAGNMRTEDMSLLNNNPQALSDAVCKFVSDLSIMKIEKGWGANFAYASAAANKLPQQKVMDIASMKRFSLNEILTKVLRTENELEDAGHVRADLALQNGKMPMVVGGGETFKSFLDWQPSEVFLGRAIFFISKRNLEHFLENYDKQLLDEAQIIFVAPNNELIEFKKQKLTLNAKNIQYVAAQKIKLSKLQNDGDVSTRLEKLQIFNGNEALFPHSPLYTALNIIEEEMAEEALMLGFDGYTDQNVLEDEAAFCFEASSLRLLTPYRNRYSLDCV